VEKSSRLKFGLKSEITYILFRYSYFFGSQKEKVFQVLEESVEQNVY
jgi:hypothetical protein